MKIKILSDSTCDLPQVLLKQYDITLIPLTVIKADHEFKDGLTITPAEIFSHVAAGGALCSTSAVSVGEYQDYFARYTKDYDGIIQICLGSGFSTCYQNACLAAADFPNVKVIDSMNLTVGQGLIAIKAGQLAPEVNSLEELEERLLCLIDKVETSFMVDQLTYLVKGGRCSSAAALGANLLNLKPCIELKENKMSVGKKYRGNIVKSLGNYAHERVADRDDIDRDLVFIVHSDIPQEAIDTVRTALDTSRAFRKVIEANAGCTISCHCGPGTLGLVFFRR